MRVGSRTRGLFLLVFGLHPACSYALPALPARPPEQLARMARAAPPTRPGYGIVVFGTEDEPARVYEIARRGRAVSYEAVLCRHTPCARRLRVGLHEVAFSGQGDVEPQGIVVVGARPSVAVSYQGGTRSPAVALLGAPLALAGLILTVSSVVLALEEPTSEGDWAMGVRPGITAGEVVFFAISGGILTGGVALGAWGGRTIPPRVGQWNLRQ